MKKGRISKDEERTIARLVDSMTPEDIAKKLNRDTSSVESFIKRKFKVGLTNEEFAAYSLEDRPYWVELKAQFTDHELELFKYHWSRIISQFKDDVFPTEELQVVDVIKLEILMNRCLKGNKENIEQINTYDHMIKDERSRDKDQQDHDYIINLERQVASLRASQESLNRDYRELQAKKASMEKMRIAMKKEEERLSSFHKYEDGTVDQPFLSPETVKD
jgi:hypothetical protein